MDQFITASASSKNALNMMTVSSSLPVNILIFGEEGVGKRRLAETVFPELLQFEGESLEDLFRQKKVDFSDEDAVLVFNIDKAGNVVQLVEQLENENVKIIATARSEKEIFNEKFLVKIDLLPLSERPEDTKELVDGYISQAQTLFKIEDDLDRDLIDVNLSDNSISLKESIYRSVLINSIDQKQIMGVIEQFLSREIETRTDYKELLEIFEVPLLRAMRKKYKSQLQMASKLNINRNTLRKKMYQYGLEEK